MTKKVISRRQVLRSATGFTLALPFLPSLVAGPAYGQDPVMARQKRFVAFETRHGQVDYEAMFPSPATVERRMLYPGHEIRRAALARTVNGSSAEVSTLLSAPADQLTPALVSKLNLFLGIDVPFYVSHNRGAALGNYADCDGNGGNGVAIQGRHTPTIDHLIAWSPGFTRDPSSLRQRQVHGGFTDGLSWGYSAPSESASMRGGEIQREPAVSSPRVLFDRLFAGVSSDPMAERRTPVVDRVLEGYNRLRTSNRRLSRSDRQRLDEHMQYLADVQRRLGTEVSAECVVPGRPAGSMDPRVVLTQTIDVVAAALRCGTTNVAAIGFPEQLDVNGYDGDWHQSVAHEANTNPDSQRRMREVHQYAFHMMVRLGQALDVEIAPGVTLLDDSLIYWSQENGGTLPPGRDGHSTCSVPVVTLGSAGGFFHTGHFYDYRNMNLPFDEVLHQGVFHQQLLATFLAAMGVQRSEWEGIPREGSTGYGHLAIGDGHGGHVSGVEANASEPLDWVTA